jgi:acetolactate synthase-1/2/3 large subunit
VVEALGGYGELVERPEDVRPALDRAFKSGLPACVNVICDATAEYPRSSVLM